MNNKKIEINITIHKNTNIFNEFNSNQLSEDLSTHIYNQCRGYSVNKNIIINILHDYEINNEEKWKIIDALRENYGIDIRENNIRLNYEIRAEIILTLLGSILLILSRFIDSLNALLLDEIISIFGCMLIWEVAYNIVFVNTKMRIKNKRLKKLTEAKIIFKKTKN